MRTLKEVDAERRAEKGDGAAISKQNEDMASQLALTLPNQLQKDFQVWPLVRRDGAEITMTNADATVAILVQGSDRFLVSGSSNGVMLPPSNVNGDGMMELLLTVLVDR